MTTTQARLKELFTYDHDAGVLIRRITISSRATAGAIAGRLHHKGYRHVRVDGAEHQAHRLIWLYVHGAWPSGQIDHINGNKADNRLENLRDVDNQANQHNRRTKQRNNTSGATGVRREGRRWQASIKVDGRNRRLGAFPTMDEAVSARAQAKAVMHPSAPA